MNCGYWTKAIALMRVPRHLHSCSLTAISLWRYPASRAPSATNCVALLKELPSCRSSRWLQHTVKMRLRPLRQVFSPLGRTWGPRRDALGLSHLTYETTRTISCHQLDQPPFPCALNLSLDSSRVNKRFCSNRIFSFAVLWLGTSSFQFPDWHGRPSDLQHRTDYWSLDSIFHLTQIHMCVLTYR